MYYLQLCCKCLFLLVTTTFIFFASGAVVEAATYYVAPTGSDSKPGTYGQPWGSIQHAADKAEAGDTVYVRGGIYHEEIRLANSGVAGQPIRFRAYGSELPVIDGRYLLPEDEPNKCNDSVDPPRCSVSTALVRIPGSYIEFDGFKITRSRGVGIGIRAAAGNEHVTIRNCQVHETRNGAINGARINHLLVEGCDIYHAGNVMPRGRSGTVFSWAPVVAAGDSQHIIYRNNIIHENWGEGLAAGVGSTDVLIEDNVLYDNFALQLYVNRVQDVIIQRNLIYHTDDPQFQRGGDPSQCIVLNNELVDDVSILVNNILIQNNVITGCKTNIAIWGGQSDEFSVRDVQILHNTLVDTHTNTDADTFALAISSNATLSNITVERNIIFQSNGNVGSAPALSTVTFANNLWSHAPPATMRGNGDLVADPRLAASVNPLTPGKVEIDWFKPLSNSPATSKNIGPFEYLSQRRSTSDASNTYPYRSCEFRTAPFDY